MEMFEHAATNYVQFEMFLSVMDRYRVYEYLPENRLKVIHEPIHFTATFVDEEGIVLSEVTFGYFGGPNVLFSVEQKEGDTVMWKPSVEISGYEYLTSNMVTEYQFKKDNQTKPSKTLITHKKMDGESHPFSVIYPYRY